MPGVWVCNWGVECGGLEVEAGLVARRRQLGFFSEEGRGILGSSHALSLILSTGKGGGEMGSGLVLSGGWSDWWIQIPQTRGKTAAEGSDRRDDARVNAVAEDAATDGKVERGCESRGWQLADLMEGEIQILKREGRLLQALAGEKRRKKKKKGREGKEEV